MKDLSAVWAEPFRKIVQDIPEETEAKSVRLEDWIPKKNLWDNLGGRITLVGDAAHAMTMCKSNFNSLLITLTVRKSGEKQQIMGLQM